MENNMCFCPACEKWRREASGYPASVICKNKQHCICCELGHCFGCNHGNIPFEDGFAVHFHANVGLQKKYQFQIDDWVIIEAFDNFSIEKTKKMQGN